VRYQIIQALQHAQERSKMMSTGVLSQHDLDETHERTADLTDRFIACLQIHVPSLIITRATSTGFDLAWNPNNECIRIELCMNAPLIAVFFYGTPPRHVVDGYSACSEAYHLIVLTPEEINELDQKNLYHLLF
jgi:hypothetical protein